MQCVCVCSLQSVLHHIYLHMLNKYIFFFKQKTAYEMRISDWSSDVCSSDLNAMKVWGGEGDFLELLKADPEIAGKVPDDKLAACFDASYHTKHVDTIFTRVFGPTS